MKKIRVLIVDDSRTFRAFLASLLAEDGVRAAGTSPAADPLAARRPHFAARANRVIYLHLTGSPPHLDLFDYKPQLAARQGRELPDSIRRGQRLTSIWP